MDNINTNIGMTFSSIQKKYVENGYNNDIFEKSFKEYKELKDFKINENVADVGGISEEAHFIMRTIAQYHLEQAFKAMKVDLNDSNVTGEKGTPYRVTKMWTGSGTNDDRELLSGRWADKPRVATFPNTHKMNVPITKRVDLTAVCSHHLAPFSAKFRDDAYAVISYIPEDFVLGISKLPRLVNWISQRGWLQEELTQKIYEEISDVACTENVYVKLYNIVHTCESLRGAKTEDGTFTSEYYGGDFKDFQLRQQVLQK